MSPRPLVPLSSLSPALPPVPCSLCLASFPLPLVPANVLTNQPVFAIVCRLISSAIFIEYRKENHTVRERERELRRRRKRKAETLRAKTKAAKAEAAAKKAK